MFYLILAGICLVAAAILLMPALVPSWKRADENAVESQAIAVYKAQLAELEKDAERGAISQADIELARSEIARRILAAGENSQPVPKGRGNRLVPAFFAVFLPGLALGIYLWHGNPHMAVPDVPQNLAEAKTPADLVKMVEQRMRETPEDAQGWDVLGRAYVEMRRVQDAKIAFERAIRHGGETAPRLAALAEAEVMLAKGAVEPYVERLLEKALTLDANNAKAISFLALGREQKGELDAAKALWQRLASIENQDPRYVQLAQNRLAQLSAPLKGPTQEDVAAAQNLSQDDRAALIASMVSQLEERLYSSGGSLAEWQQLLRAQMVQNRLDAAKMTLAKGLENLQNTQEAQEALRSFALNLSPDLVSPTQSAE